MILLTGFQGYGGYSENPAAAVALALDGQGIGDLTIVGRQLPVDIHDLAETFPRLIDEVTPNLILSLGLWPGETMVRLERVATNWADFEIPDNRGLRLSGRLRENGPDGYLLTLPVDDIRPRLLRAGIPARFSGSAGHYLCNALSYLAMDHCARHHQATRVGFIHLPYLPAQVSELVERLALEGTTELHQRADLASMSLDTMLAAVRLALETAVELS